MKHYVSVSIMDNQNSPKTAWLYLYANGATICNKSISVDKAMHVMAIIAKYGILPTMSVNRYATNIY